MNNSSISVIIPAYNEEKTIGLCLATLAKQSDKPKEIILIDDGSVDKTQEIIIRIQKEINIPLTILKQNHQGTAIARNFGASKAMGDILVFVDSDMEFEDHFLEKLIQPIVSGTSKGTFTKEEYVKNWDNMWAQCWNFNEGIYENRRIPKTYPNTSPVFRAILKEEFDRVGGFDDIGFTDDWTLSRKLRYEATAASGAICYHKNPSTITEVYRQARWIGKNEFISGTCITQLISLVRYSIPVQLFRSIVVLIQTKEPAFFIFDAVYSLGIYRSIIGIWMGEKRYK